MSKRQRVEYNMTRTGSRTSPSPRYHRRLACVPCIQLSFRGTGGTPMILFARADFKTASNALSKRQRLEWVERNETQRDLEGDALNLLFRAKKPINPIFQLARQREIVNLDECPMEF